MGVCVCVSHPLRTQAQTDTQTDRHTDTNTPSVRAYRPFLSPAFASLLHLTSLPFSSRFVQALWLELCSCRTLPLGSGTLRGSGCCFSFASLCSLACLLLRLLHSTRSKTRGSVLGVTTSTASLIHPPSLATPNCFFFCAFMSSPFDSHTPTPEEREELIEEGIELTSIPWVNKEN